MRVFFFLKKIIHALLKALSSAYILCGNEVKITMNLKFNGNFYCRVKKYAHKSA
jgi:hypothetical protein